MLIEIFQESSQFVKSADFDFVVFGQLLRVPLVEHLKGFSSSDVVEIEYITRILEPEPEATLPHDDWIGGVQVAQNWWVLGQYHLLM